MHSLVVAAPCVPYARGSDGVSSPALGRCRKAPASAPPAGTSLAAAHRPRGGASSPCCSPTWSGFTTLAEFRDPEQVKRLVDAAFEGLVADVERFGGRVDKVLGDAIVALFGAPVAHEDDADRAVRAGAADARDAATTSSPSSRPSPTCKLRIGINTGEVLVGTLAGTDYTAMGDVVNIASRLQELAPARWRCSSATRHACALLRRDPLRAARAGRAAGPRADRERVAGARHDRRRPPTAVAAPRSRSSDASPNARCCSRSPSSSPPDTARSCRWSARPGSASRASSTRRSPRSTTARPASASSRASARPYGEPNVWWPIAHGLAAGMGLQLDSTGGRGARDRGRARRPRCTACRPTPRPCATRSRRCCTCSGTRRSSTRSTPRGARDAVYDALITSIRLRAARGPGRRVDRRSPVGAPAAARTARADGAQPRRQPAADRHRLPAAATRIDWPPPVERALTLKLPIGPLDECETAALVEAVAGRRPEHRPRRSALRPQRRQPAVPHRARPAHRLGRRRGRRRRAAGHAAGPDRGPARPARADPTGDPRQRRDPRHRGTASAPSPSSPAELGQAVRRAPRRRPRRGRDARGRGPALAVPQRRRPRGRLPDAHEAGAGAAPRRRRDATWRRSARCRSTTSPTTPPLRPSCSTRSVRCRVSRRRSGRRRSICSPAAARRVVRDRRLPARRRGVRAGAQPRRRRRRRAAVAATAAGVGSRRDAGARQRPLTSCSSCSNDSDGADDRVAEGETHRLLRRRRAARRRSRRRPARPRSGRRHLPRARRRPAPRDGAAGARVRRDLRWLAGRRRVVPRRGRRDLRPCRRRARAGLGAAAPGVGRVPER